MLALPECVNSVDASGYDYESGKLITYVRHEEQERWRGVFGWNQLTELPTGASICLTDEKITITVNGKKITMSWPAEDGK